MKELHARAQVSVSAPEAEVLALLRDVEGYPRWYPEGVREVKVLDRDDAGAASRVRATLHVGQGPIVRDFGLTLVVTEPQPGTIKLTRKRHDGKDQEEFEVTWVVSGGRIQLALDANLSVPRLLPVGGIGDGLANGFVSAAAKTLT
jgi:ribosome-associated toxin RatA of RatAB toxin-antitoxin module